MNGAAATMHVVVRGRVQGVGFRWFVKEEARRLDLAGWTRNLADGGVEVRAAGDVDAIGRLRRAVATGPAGAAVASIEEVASPGVDQELPRPFAIHR